MYGITQNCVPVMRAAQEGSSRDAVGGLQQEGPGIVIHEHHPPQVTPQPAQVFDVVPPAHARRRLPARASPPRLATALC